MGKNDKRVLFLLFSYKNDLLPLQDESLDSHDELQRSLPWKEQRPLLQLKYRMPTKSLCLLSMRFCGIVEYCCYLEPLDDICEADTDEILEMSDDSLK